ncbi:hypothetical protein R3P38DRAFT_2827238 [Favolaschia claudopus]|uniref:Uncharacterized protein n=1 Tax=Favolaschia claudopus TaxID=2862362 RepID=A0AAW0EKZ0_9AGAR
MEDVSDTDVWGIGDVQMPPAAVQAQEVSDPHFPGPSSFYVPSLDELNEELERFLPPDSLKRKGDTSDSPSKKPRPSPAAPTAPHISDGSDSDSEEDFEPPLSKSAGKQRSSLSVEIDTCIKSILDRLADEGQQREALQAKHAESVATAKLDGSFDPLDDDDAFHQHSEAFSNWPDLSAGLDELFKLMDIQMNTNGPRVSHHVDSDDDTSNSYVGSSTGHHAHPPKASSSIVGDREQDARSSAKTKPYLKPEFTGAIAGSILSRPKNDAEMLGHANLFDYDERDRAENRCPCLKCHPIPGLKFDPNDPDFMSQQEVHRLFAQSLFANPSDSDSLVSSDE